MLWPPREEIGASLKSRLLGRLPCSLTVALVSMLLLAGAGMERSLASSNGDHDLAVSIVGESEPPSLSPSQAHALADRIDASLTFSSFLGNVFSSRGDRTGSAGEFTGWLEDLRDRLRSGISPSSLRESSRPPGRLVTRTVFVTHAHLRWDPWALARPGIDRAISQLEGYAGTELIYVTESADAADSAFWYTARRDPDVVHVSSGEHPFAVKSNQVIFLGGGFGACQGETVSHAIRQYAGDEPLNLHFPMDAIYANVYETVEDLWRRRGPNGFLAAVERAFYIDRAEQRFLFDLHEPRHLDLSSDYRLQIHIDGRLLQRIGRGARLVNLNFFTSSFGRL